MALFDGWLGGGNHGEDVEETIILRPYGHLERYLRGAAQFKRGDDGFVQPYRFTPEQMEMLGYIGRQERAVATSGIVLDFTTNGDTIAFDCRVTRPLNRAHAVYDTVLQHEGVLGQAEDGIIDGIDIVIGAQQSYTTTVADGTVQLSFDNPAHEWVEIRIYLPYIMSVAVGNLAVNGDVDDAPKRGYLLALGDSITQGFVVGCPSLTYPAQVAAALGLDLLNQGIAGHVFDRRTLRGLTDLRSDPPQAITVAYGTNDWARKETTRAIQRGAERYFSRLLRTFPGVDVYVMSPLWRADEDEPVAAGVPLTWMGDMLKNLCDQRKNLHFIDGHGAIPKNPVMLADGRLHPGSVDAAMVADALIAAIAADGIGSVSTATVPLTSNVTVDAGDAREGEVTAPAGDGLAEPEGALDNEPGGDARPGADAREVDAAASEAIPNHAGSDGTEPWADGGQAVGTGDAGDAGDASDARAYAEGGGAPDQAGASVAAPGVGIAHEGVPAGAAVEGPVADDQPPADEADATWHIDDGLEGEWGDAADGVMGDGDMTPGGGDVEGAAEDDGIPAAAADARSGWARAYEGARRADATARGGADDRAPKEWDPAGDTQGAEAGYGYGDPSGAPEVDELAGNGQADDEADVGSGAPEGDDQPAASPTQGGGAVGVDDTRFDRRGTAPDISMLAPHVAAAIREAIELVSDKLARGSVDIGHAQTTAAAYAARTVSDAGAAPADMAVAADHAARLLVDVLTGAMTLDDIAPATAEDDVSAVGPGIASEDDWDDLDADDDWDDLPDDDAGGSRALTSARGVLAAERHWNDLDNLDNLDDVEDWVGMRAIAAAMDVSESEPRAEDRLDAVTPIEDARATSTRWPDDRYDRHPQALEADEDTMARPDAPGAHPDFERLVRTVWRLRQSDGCPWDRAQTHESITRNMIEEAYEAVDAITEGDVAHLREELGDVLEQVLLHAQIAADAHDFTIDDVCRELNEKLIRRHPHVFGDDVASTADEALDRWNDVKRAERAALGEEGRGRGGLLDSVPTSLPALMQAQKVSERAASLGFEWESVEKVWEKVAEESEEFVHERPGSKAAAMEFGDLLFTLVNVARFEGINAEEALAASTRKFRGRWKTVERTANAWGRAPETLSPLEFELLWEHAKSEEGIGTILRSGVHAHDRAHGQPTARRRDERSASPRRHDGGEGA